ncbi:MAG: adenine-specific methyltransferase EcoRI family protein, partial [Candidatus Diapherotrites archaeon]
NFHYLRLKKLIVTHFGNGKPSYKLEKTNGDTVKTPLKQNGDFRSPECIEILKEADIIVTNPPFSLFREYVAQLIEYNKKFIIIGHQNAISYKEIFKLIKENKIWLGYGFNGGASHFINKHYEDYATAGNHKDGMIRISGVIWFTNLEIQKRHEELILYKTYKGNEKDYPKYDNYDAINVDKTKDIPKDYKGTMGVPITFMDKYNPDQFEIIGQMATTKIDEFNHGYPFIAGEKRYARVIIRNKKV